MSGTERHPAAPRWQAATIPPDAVVNAPTGPMQRRICRLVWVDAEDWQRFMDWQRDNIPPEQGSQEA